MFKTEIILHWSAVACYAISSCLFVFALVFKKNRFLSIAVAAALLGIFPHAAALALRWIETGHGPYLRKYEVYSSDALIGVFMFLFLQWRKPALRVAGIIILPVTFLLIGMGVLSSPEIRPLPDSFQTFWLLVHIFFAKLAYGSCLIGTALALFHVLKTKNAGSPRIFIEKLPNPDVLDDLSYRFLGFGFIMIGIMIAAGAIWANKAWGRYWGWDPVETWSLISWIIYGIYLHLRRIHGWKGAKAAVFSVAAFLVLLFALLGIGIVYVTNHSPYIS